jgi:alpha-beta hydrolase superfamily lysophospholipase
MKRRRRRKILLGVILSAILAVNAVAFMQAWSMTHFVADGERTNPPEQLSVQGKLWVLLMGVNIPRPVNRRTPADFGLAFQTGHVRSKDVDLEVWSIPADRSPRGLVLMYHAYVSSKSSLLAAARQFHQMGYSVEMVDFRGSGGSSGNSTTLGFREADDVRVTVADARQNLLAAHEPLILFGQSMGAAAVLRAVGDLGVSPDAIIIESPYDRLLATVGDRCRAMRLPAFPLAELLVFWGGVQQGYWAFHLNPAVSAVHVHCPVLMFHGQLDTRVTPEQAKAVFDNLAGPKQLEWYQQAGHCAFLSTDAGRWRQAVADFLARLSERGGSDLGEREGSAHLFVAPSGERSGDDTAAEGAIEDELLALVGAGKSEGSAFERNDLGFGELLCGCAEANDGQFLRLGRDHQLD